MIRTLLLLVTACATARLAPLSNCAVLTPPCRSIGAPPIVSDPITSWGWYGYGWYWEIEQLHQWAARADRCIQGGP